MKRGDKVVAHNTHGVQRNAVFVKRHKTAKGDWLEIKPHDGSPNYKTRASCVVVLRA